MACMNPNHDHFDESVLSAGQREFLKAMDLLGTRITGLPGDEERMLLLASQVTALGSSAQAIAGAALQGASAEEVASALNDLVALTTFAERTITSTQDGHTDWFKSGDRRTDELLADYLTAVRALRASGAIQPEEIPEDLTERLVAGETTEEDKRFMFDLARSKGLIPDDADFEEFELYAEARESGGSTDGGTLTAKGPEAGTGQYL